MRACEILAPQPRMEPTTPALQSTVLTIRLPGKSLTTHILKFSGKEKTTQQIALGQ